MRNYSCDRPGKFGRRAVKFPDLPENRLIGPLDGRGAGGTGPNLCSQTAVSTETCPTFFSRGLQLNKGTDVL